MNSLRLPYRVFLCDFAHEPKTLMFLFVFTWLQICYKALLPLHGNVYVRLEKKKRWTAQNEIENGTVLQGIGSLYHTISKVKSKKRFRGSKNPGKLRCCTRADLMRQPYYNYEIALPSFQSREPVRDLELLIHEFLHYFENDPSIDHHYVTAHIWSVQFMYSICFWISYYNAIQ